MNKTLLIVVGIVAVGVVVYLLLGKPATAPTEPMVETIPGSQDEEMREDNMMPQEGTDSMMQDQQ